jgi:hypothetical protein
MTETGNQNRDGYVRSRHYTRVLPRRQRRHIDGTNCYYKSQNADAELTSRIDDAPTSTDTGNSKWRQPDRK